MAKNYKRKEHVKPRMSLNKLGEYMTADSLRRRQIIKDAKFPAGFKTNRYQEVRNCICEYIISNYDITVIEECEELIREKEKNSSWKADDGGNSLLALQHLRECDLPDLSNYSIAPAPEFSSDTYNINGLSVSMYPDLYLESDKNSKVGAIKIHLSKTYPLIEENRECIATLLKYRYVLNGKEQNEIDGNACISFDVFGRSYNISANAYVMRVRRVEAACQEICAVWPTITL